MLIQFSQIHADTEGRQIQLTWRWNENLKNYEFISQEFPMSLAEIHTSEILIQYPEDLVLDYKNLTPKEFDQVWCRIVTRYQVKKHLINGVPIRRPKPLFVYSEE